MRRDGNRPRLGLMAVSLLLVSLIVSCESEEDAGGNTSAEVDQFEPAGGAELESAVELAQVLDEAELNCAANLTEQATVQLEAPLENVSRSEAYCNLEGADRPSRTLIQIQVFSERVPGDDIEEIQQASPGMSYVVGENWLVLCRDPDTAESVAGALGGAIGRFPPRPEREDGLTGGGKASESSVPEGLAPTPGGDTGQFPPQRRESGLTGGPGAG